MSDSHFTGFIADGYNDVHFSLYHTYSPNWEKYDNWGYDDWDDDCYYARQTRGAEGNDSTATAPEKPIRQFGKKATELP
jgi:hypothetical protein